jgi:hypothetical protein
MVPMIVLEHRCVERVVGVAVGINEVEVEDSIFGETAVVVGIMVGLVEGLEEEVS